MPLGRCTESEVTDRVGHFRRVQLRSLPKRADLRDRLFAELDATDLATLLVFEEGLAQTEISKRLDIDPAAITRRKHRRGIDTLRAAYRSFDELALAEPDAAAVS